MKRGFVLVKRGRWRLSAARGMARAGFSAAIIAVVLRIRISTARDVVCARNAPTSLWNAAQLALLKREGF